MRNEDPDDATLLSNTNAFRALCVSEGDGNPVTDVTKFLRRSQETSSGRVQARALRRARVERLVNTCQLLAVSTQPSAAPS